METREKYIKALEAKMKKYKNKISDVDSLLKNSKFHNKPHLVTESKTLKEKFKQAEDIFQQLKSSSKENFEEIKDSTAEIFDALKDALSDFSHFLTMDQIYHAKDEIAEYGCEKISEAEEYIKKKPLICAAGAFGVGFLIGTLLMRSK